MRDCPPSTPQLESLPSIVKDPYVAMFGQDVNTDDIEKDGVTRTVTCGVPHRLRSSGSNGFGLLGQILAYMALASVLDVKGPYKKRAIVQIVPWRPLSGCSPGAAEAERALQLLDATQSRGIAPDAITYGAAISTSEKGQQSERALQLLDEMQVRGTLHNVTTYSMEKTWRQGLCQAAPHQLEGRGTAETGSVRRSPGTRA